MDKFSSNILQTLSNSNPEWTELYLEAGKEFNDALDHLYTAISELATAQEKVNKLLAEKATEINEQ